jgi:hypothetical protein
MSDMTHYISIRLSSEPLPHGREALSQPSIICVHVCVRDFFLYSITFGQIARNWSAEKETAKDYNIADFKKC